MGLVELLTRGTSDLTAPGTDESPTQARILDAVVGEAAARGVKALSVEGVAKRAGMNRATVYRHFGDREGLLAAMTMREGRRFATAVTDAMAAATTPLDQFVEGFVTAVRLAEQHPIVSRTARHEPEDLIAAGLAHGAELLGLGSAVMTAAVRDAQAAGLAQHVDADEAGETLARLFAAFVLLPVTRSIDLSTDEAARAYARRTLAPMVLGAGSEAGTET